MLLKKYEEAGYQINANLQEACSGGKLNAYRGELIIVERNARHFRPPQAAAESAAASRRAGR